MSQSGYGQDLEVPTPPLGPGAFAPEAAKASDPGAQLRPGRRGSRRGTCPGRGPNITVIVGVPTLRSRFRRIQYVDPYGRRIPQLKPTTLGFANSAQSTKLCGPSRPYRTLRVSASEFARAQNCRLVAALLKLVGQTVVVGHAAPEYSSALLANSANTRS